MPSPYDSSPSVNVSLTGDPNVDPLLAGLRWAPQTLTFSFPGSTATWAGGYVEPTNGFHAFSAEGQAHTRAALQAWGDVCGLDFVETADTDESVGDLRFALSRASPSPGASGWARYPSEDPQGGDVWFNGNVNIGTDGERVWTPWDHTILLHEIGHALGLKHPSEGIALPASLDDQACTVMSYNDHYDFTPTTPMLLDVAAIQALYGADLTSHAGNDVYRFDAAQRYFETIWDSGGSDTIAYSGARDGVIDLRAGEASRLGRPVTDYFQGGKAFNSIFIAYNCVIENAVGGAGNDELIGNDAANKLDGGAGADRMSGGAGNDRYVIDDAGDAVVEAGGGGVDALLCAVSYKLPGEIENAQLTGTSARNLSGNALNNNLTGNAAANKLSGAAGDDLISGGRGNDALKGGTGNDSFAFTTKLDARHNVDAIVDFSHADDRVLLDHRVFDALGGKVTRGELRQGISARDANDHLVYDSAHGKLYYDADGKGGSAAVLFATLQPGTVLGHDDFFVV